MVILKIFKPHLLPNGKQIEAKLGGRHWGDMDSELLETFCYDIGLVSLPRALLQVSLCHGLLIMVRPSSLYPSVTFHIFDISIRIVSMMATMAAILKVISCYLLPNSKLDGAETWWKASGQHGDLELLK